jgi:phosphopantetheinyl transferase
MIDHAAVTRMQVSGASVLLSDHALPEASSADLWHHSVASECGAAPEHVRIVTSRGRAPVAWVRGRRCWLSFSASRGVRACAVDPRGPVGIDVERTDLHPPLRDGELDHLMSVALRPEEADRCRRAANQVLAFLIEWTIKEAVLKAAGVGLAVDPRRVRSTGARTGEASLDGKTYLVSTITTGLAVTSVALPRRHRGAVTPSNTPTDAALR